MNYISRIGGLVTALVITALLLPAGTIAIAGPSDLNAGLVGYWKFDNPNDLGLDNSGFENSGTATPGDVAYTAGGIVNGAAKFVEGTINAAIRVPHSDSLNLTEEITMAAWVKLDGSDTDNGDAIFAKDGVNQPYALFGVLDDVFSGAMGAWYSGRALNSDSVIPTARWTHVATTYDGTMAKFYIDGSSISERASSVGLREDLTSDLYIGASPFGAPEDFSGLMDEARIYNRVLSEAEILELASVSTILVSSSSGGGVGGVMFKDEDILAYNQASGAWSMYFDGSDVGLRRNDINAFTLLDDGNILMSFNVAGEIPSFGTVSDSDIVEFTPTSLGDNTAGTFTWYLDGSDVGLDGDSEDIGSISLTPNGRLVVSTRSSFTVTGLSGKDEDLIVLNNATFGEDSAGEWALYFDGSDVGLTATDEDVNGAWVDAAADEIYLATKGEFAVSGVRGDASDIFICTLESHGVDTECGFKPLVGWSSAGFAAENIDGLAILDSSQVQVRMVPGEGDATVLTDNEADDYEEDVDDIDFDMANTDGQIYQSFLPVVTQ